MSHAFCVSGVHLNSFVSPSVRPSVRHNKFNLAHIIWSFNDRALIFGMHDPCDKPFHLAPCRDLDPLQGQNCCGAGDHNSPNLLVVYSAAHALRLYEYTMTLYRDREIHLSVKDLQTLQIFDTRVDFPVPVQSCGWLFFSYRSPHDNPIFAFKCYFKNFLLRRQGQLGLIITSCHCMIYDVTRCSLKRSCLSRVR